MKTSTDSFPALLSRAGNVNFLFPDSHFLLASVVRTD